MTGISLEEREKQLKKIVIDIINGFTVWTYTGRMKVKYLPAAIIPKIASAVVKKLVKELEGGVKYVLR